MTFYTLYSKQKQNILKMIVLRSPTCGIDKIDKDTFTNA